MLAAAPAPRSLVGGRMWQRVQRRALGSRPASSSGRGGMVLEAPSSAGDGVKVAKEVAEELREETGVQLDSDAWQQQAEGGEPAEAATVWYFAFGSNMNKSVLTGRRMVKPAESAAAVLPGYRLSFNMPGFPFREPAFAGVERLPAGSDGVRGSSSANGSSSSSSGGANGSSTGQEAAANGGAGAAQQDGSASSDPSSGGTVAAAAVMEVHGVVHRITPSEWQHVLETEGAATSSDFGYAAEAVTVEAYDGRRLEAWTLVVQPKSAAFLKGREALPSLRYLNLLRVGAEEHGLAPSYRAYLDALQPYQAASLRRRLGAAVMGAVFVVLVAPVFVGRRLYAKAVGMSPKESTSNRLVTGYLHTVFGLAWRLHDLLQPVLGCGCTNDGLPAASAGASKQ